MNPLRFYNFAAKEPQRIKAEVVGGVGHIRIYEPIMQDYGYDAKALLNDLQAAKDQGATSIALHINSPGGDVFEARSMGAILRASGLEIAVYVDGMAASAASELALRVGGKITMAIGSWLMIHEASTIGFGNKREMQKIADLLARFDSEIVDSYANKTGLPIEQINAMLEAETWLSADDALAGKWADAIEGQAVIENNWRNVWQGSPVPEPKNKSKKANEDVSAVEAAIARNKNTVRLLQI